MTDQQRRCGIGFVVSEEQLGSARPFAWAFAAVIAPSAA